MRPLYPSTGSCSDPGLSVAGPRRRGLFPRRLAYKRAKIALKTSEHDLNRMIFRRSTG